MKNGQPLLHGESCGQVRDGFGAHPPGECPAGSNPSNGSGVALDELDRFTENAAFGVGVDEPHDNTSRTPRACLRGTPAQDNIHEEYAVVHQRDLSDLAPVLLARRSESDWNRGERPAIDIELDKRLADIGFVLHRGVPGPGEHDAPRGCDSAPVRRERSSQR